jgi:fumarate reductase subunit D
MQPEEPVKDQAILPVAPAKETVRDQDKIMLVLSYLGLLALIPLLTVKDSEYVKWHAKNGLVLGVGGWLLSIVLGFLPVVNLLTCVLGPAVLVVDIIAMIKALGGERWRIPVVTDLAEKI